MMLTLTLRTLRFQMFLIWLMIASAALLAGWLVYDQQVSQKERAALATQEDKIHHISALLNRELGELRDILHLLRIDTQVATGLRAAHALQPQAVAQGFVRFGKAIEHLMQIRWLDASGVEQVRVDIDSDHGPKVIASDLLQPKGHRYYFMEAMKLPSDTIYLSQIDLNEELGQVVLPHQPTIRAALQTGNGDQLRPGLLIVNYSLGKLLRTAEQFSDTTTEVQLVDESGFWLLHSRPEMRWGQQLNPENNIRIQQTMLWRAMQSTPTAAAKRFNGELISYRKTTLLTDESQAQNRHFYIITKTPASVVSAYKKTAVVRALILGAVLLLIGTYLLAREYRSRLSLIDMTSQLHHENERLGHANRKLDNALRTQRRLQDDLVESRKLSALGMMVAGIAHELNTPIGSALLTVTDQQQGRDELARAVHSGLTRQALLDYLHHSEAGLTLAKTSLERASELIQSFKRMAFERMQDDPAAMQIAQVVDDLARTLHPHLKHTKITLHNTVPTELTIVSLPGILSQVLQNLIINAVSHGFEAHQVGEVTVSASVDAEGSYVEIMVTDNGKGISEEHISTLFDPFVTTGRDRGHTGLGLHLVHLWVRQKLKGTVDFTPSSTGGAAFIIKIPTDINNAAQNTPHS